MADPVLDSRRSDTKTPKRNPKPAYTPDRTLIQYYLNAGPTVEYGLKVLAAKLPQLYIYFGE